MEAEELKKILVVEDNERHRKEARQYFKKIKGLKVLYATNVEEAIDSNWDNYLRSWKELQPAEKITKRENYPLIYRVDGVITDLYLPWHNKEISPGFSDEKEIERVKHLIQVINDSPNGLIVAAACKSIGKPSVICTSGLHHGSKYEWANRLSNMLGTGLIDGKLEGGIKSWESEAVHKNWEEAFKILENKAKYMKNGN